MLDSERKRRVTNQLITILGGKSPISQFFFDLILSHKQTWNKKKAKNFLLKKILRF